MGDISEIRGLVVVVSFLGILVLLMSQIPSALYTAGEMREVDIPTEWEGIDLQSFVETWNSTSINLLYENFDIGGRNMALDSDYSDDHIGLWHRYGFLLLFHERGYWYNRMGILVSTPNTSPPIGAMNLRASNLDDAYSSYGDIKFTVKFDFDARFQVTALFDFNETTYSAPSVAWQNDDLNILVGIGFDHINTGYTAWDLIAMIMFFQLPNVSPILMSIIAIPIWVATAYIAFILILRAIGAIFGGGA